MVPAHALPAVAALLLLGACAEGASPAGQGQGGRRATTCKVTGFQWNRSPENIAPLMTVSSDGSCYYSVALHSSLAIGMAVDTPPAHGTLTTSGASQRPSFRYRPTPGYAGPDSFTVLTGNGGGVVARVAVTVVR